MAISQRATRTLDFFDPLGLFPHTDKENTNNDIDKYGRVVGFGSGPAARATQQNYLDSLIDQSGAGYDAIGQGILGAEEAANLGKLEANYGRTYANQGQAMMGTAAQGFTEGVQQGQQGILGAATQGQQGILGAAAQRDPSQALIQQARGLADARGSAQQIASTMSRGGNSALAQRAAQQANRDQSFDAAQGAAMIRAQEEAAYNQRQVAAQQAAAQLGMAGQQSAADLGLSGASGMAGLGTDRFGRGVQMQQHGADTVLGSGIAQGQLGSDLATQAGDLAYDYGTAQTNTDTGFAAAGAQAQATKEAGNAGLLGGLLGALI